MIPIPKKIREAQNKDPQFTDCMLKAYPGHVCGGRLTREHAIIYAGKRLQVPWSIICICAKGHAVDEYQDAGTMKKEMNVWVALNRATEGELRAISKAINYIHYRDRLNAVYGPYIPIEPVYKDVNK